jgi:serine protease
MRSAFSRVFACLFSALLLTLSAAVAGPPGKVHPDLDSKFAGKSAGHREKVIISLEASVPPGLSRAQAVAEAQGRVLDAFRNENNGKGLGVLNRYQTLFGFSAELTQGQVNALARRDDVAFVEPMPIHQKMFPESHPLTEVNLAQAGGYVGTGAVIAFIDDGIDLGHAAFSGKYLGGRDFADNDNDPSIDCLNQSHGTAVAGVALGNGGGVLGVAPAAKFVFLKIQSSGICGSSSLDGDIVGAIDWATANQATYGIDIISMSLGGGLYSSESNCDGSSSIYRNAVENAAAAGITVLAASGNNGMCDEISRPACFSAVISVGATFDETNGETWGWCVNRNSCANTQRHSACGVSARAAFQEVIADHVIVYSNSASFLDIVAPSTCATTALAGGGTVECFGGTSSSTPFAAGTAALAVQAAGKGVLSPADMLDVLAGTGDLVSDPKNGRISPRVNALSVVLEAADYGGGEPPPNIPPTAGFTFSCTELTCTFTDTSSDSDGSIASRSWTFGDGSSSIATNPSHTYAAGGTYTVTLSVTDDVGAEDSTSQSVTVTATPPANVPPTAAFTYSCSDLTCDFTDTSSDSDGSIASRSWTFGDGSSSTATHPSHSYAAGGTYIVTLTVTDDGGADDSTSQSVTVSAPPSGGVELVGSSENNGRTWTAIATDASGGDLQGSWSRSGGSCSGNQCSLSGIPKNTGSVIFTATTGESITISKP